jgi:arylsulfatase
MMEVFAGFGAHTDYEMGRILESVRTLPDADNTLIIYILGDNGASAEGALTARRTKSRRLMVYSSRSKAR